MQSASVKSVWQRYLLSTLDKISYSDKIHNKEYLNSPN